MTRARILHQGARALSRYRLRTTMIATGTLVGVAALTLVVSVGEVATEKIVTTVRQIVGSSAIVVMAGGSQLLGGPRPETARLTIDDIEAVARAVPGIEGWDPQQAMPAAALRSREATATARVLGQSERSAYVWSRPASRGEYFDASAVRAAARVALIGETVALELFGGREPIGEEVLIASVPFEVVGILERFGTDLHGMDRDDEVVIPISTMLRRVLNIDTILTAKLLVRDAEQSEGVAGAVRRVLREQHGLSAEQPDDFTMLTPLEVQQMVAMAQRVVSLYLPLAAGVVLLASLVITATLMLASVTARTGEIGLRRAVGAMAQDIRLQFVAETALMTFAGGAVGVVLGIVGARLAALWMKTELGSSWRVIALGLFLSVLVGVVAATMPARRAANLDPATALR